MIPRVIHQIWIGPKPRPEKWMASWARLNPSWRYELWDDARCAAFGFRNARKIREMPEWCGKADIMRYEILERHGGVYVDADAECVRPLDDELLRHDSWACYENERRRPGLIANGFLGARVGCELMRRLGDAIAGMDMRAARAWIVTGPGLLTRVAADYPALHLYPSCLFLPAHYSDPASHNACTPYCDHHWGSTRGLYTRPAGRLMPWSDRYDGAVALAAFLGAAWWLRSRA